MYKIRAFLAIYISKIIIFISKIAFNGGSNLPGRVGIRLCPYILEVTAKGYEVILITGTNGKTTTTSMIYNILVLNGEKVITNATGANMYAGITSTFIKNYSLFNKKNKAIIEVDEANLKFITKYIKPKAIIITNLFRDQLDRYGEVYSTLDKILEGVKHDDTTLILNGDEPLLGDLQCLNTKKYFGITVDKNEDVGVNVEGKFCIKCKTPYSYNYVTYNHLGDYYCPKCGYCRPQIDYLVTKILNMDSEKSNIVINNDEVNLNISGLYNIYNAICAYSVCDFLNVDKQIIFNSFDKQGNAFGRQEIIKIGDKKIKLILVKNPAGYNEGISTLNKDNVEKSIGFLLNDNYADGRDISWIWDVNFENIRKSNIKKIIIGGNRSYDMAIRLKIAEFDTNNFTICDDNKIFLENLKNISSDYIIIFATYTAMIDFRKFLYSNKYIKKLW